MVSATNQNPTSLPKSPSLSPTTTASPAVWNSRPAHPTRQFARGFSNTANTCAMGSIVQCLIHHPSLFSFLRNESVISLGPTSVLCYLKPIFDKAWKDAATESFLPDELLKPIYIVLHGHNNVIVWGSQIDGIELFTTLLGVIALDLSIIGSSLSVVPEWNATRYSPCCAEHCDVWFTLPSLTLVSPWDIESSIEQEVLNRCGFMRCSRTLSSCYMSNAPALVLLSCPLESTAGVHLNFDALPANATFIKPDGTTSTYVKTGELFFEGDDQAGHITSFIQSPINGAASWTCFSDSHTTPAPPPEALPFVACYALIELDNEAEEMNEMNPLSPGPVSEPEESVDGDRGLSDANIFNDPAELNTPLELADFEAFIESTEHRSLETALIESLQQMTEGLIGRSSWDEWKQGVRKLASAEDIQKEKAEGLERKQSYMNEFHRRGLEFIGSVLPNGSRENGTAIGLCWPPHHNEETVLTRAKYTTRTLLDKGLSASFVWDLYESKILSTKNARVPQPADKPEIAAQRFAYGRQPGAQRDALTYLCVASWDRNQQNLRHRAIFPCLTLLQGLHQNYAANTAFLNWTERPRDVIMLDFTVSLEVGHLNPHVPTQLRSVLRVIAFHRNAQLLGLILLTPHGSQGAYGTVTKTPAQFESAYALDVSTNLVVDIVGYKRLTRHERWLYTRGAWPQYPLGKYHIEASLYRLREQERRCDGLVYNPAFFPLSWIDHYREIGLETGEQLRESFMEAMIRGLQLIPKRAMINTGQKGTQTREKWSPGRKAEVAKIRSEVNRRTATNTWANFEAKNGISIGEELDRRFGRGDYKTQDPITAHKAAEGVRRTTKINRDPKLFARVVISHSQGFYCFERLEDRLPPIPSSRLPQDGQDGQILSHLEFDIMERNYIGARFNLEPWFCSNHSIIYLRATQRLQDDASAIKVKQRGGMDCLHCKSKIPVCRPICGWSSVHAIRSDRDREDLISGPERDLNVSSINRRIQQVITDLRPARKSRRGKDVPQDRLRPAPSYSLWNTPIQNEVVPTAMAIGSSVPSSFDQNQGSIRNHLTFPAATTPAVTSHPKSLVQLEQNPKLTRSKPTRAAFPNSRKSHAPAQTIPFGRVTLVHHSAASTNLPRPGSGNEASKQPLQLTPKLSEGPVNKASVAPTVKKTAVGLPKPRVLATLDQNRRGILEQTENPREIVPRAGEGLLSLVKRMAGANDDPSKRRKL